jgi:tyrosine-protein kinase Etk/Wzc
MSNQEINTEGISNRSIDINKIILIILSRWYIVVTTVLLSLTIAYIQLRYTKPLYKSSTSLKFDDDRGGTVSDLFKYGRISGRIENIIKTESEVLKSRTMTKKTMQYLGLNTTEYVEGNFITSRIYPNKAFHVSFIRLDSSDVGRSFNIIINDNETYTLLEGKQRVTLRFNDTVYVKHSYLVIERLEDEALQKWSKQPIQITINDIEAMGASIAAGLDIELEKNTNIMTLSFSSDIAEFATDYVNAIAQVYITESVNSKTLAAQQIIAYIDGQLAALQKNVSNSQKNLADFKSENKGVGPQELGKAEFSQLLQLEASRNILQLRKKQLATLAKDVEKSKTKTIELLIVDGDDARSVGALIEKLNIAIMDRITLMGKYNPESPIMKDNDIKIQEIKAAVSRSIKAAEASLENNIQNNNELINTLSASLTDLPSKEQNLFNLEREFKINEKIYGYLQERRLESLIGISSIVSNISVIDSALYNNNPIFPKPGKNYLTALLIGLASGLGFIFLSRFLYNKIPDKETIEAISRTPVIGVIKKIEDEQKTAEYGIYVFKNPKSIFTESIRGIRTNANFILKGDKHKIICITSSVSGEGKTFCTVNIAASFTQLGYKVVIVGCDLRRPKLHESFGNLDNKLGLTNYLVKRATLDEIITPTENGLLSIVTSGPTPPNPSELLQTQEFQTFLDELKNRFDFVFLDTAPVGLVSDSLTLMTKADLNLFVLRAQYSKREFASTPDRLTSDNNIKNVYTILNSYDHSSVAYSSLYKKEYGDYIGGGSGYYYYGGYYGGGSGYHNAYSSYYSNYYTDEDFIKKPTWKPFSLFMKSKKNKKPKN